MEMNSTSSPQSPLSSLTLHVHGELEDVERYLAGTGKPAVATLRSRRVTDLKWDGTYAGNRCTVTE